MQKLTKNKQKKDSKTENWLLIDANNVRLGKLATKAASLLLGKEDTNSVDYMAGNNYLIITNSDKVSYHISREKNKFYYRHSGYPGGFNKISLGDQMKRDSRKIIEFAISGMLPKNKLRDKFMTRVRIFKTEKHDHEAQNPIVVEVN